jgi:hypothetical protein
MTALYLYIVACVYFYWIESDEENANDPFRLAEIAFWPVLYPFYMFYLWYKNRNQG